MTSTRNEPPWLDRFQRRAARWAGPGASKHWLVAVSGGADSVSLLRALHAVAPGLGLELTVGHLDHGARGAAAVEDSEFVGELARSLGLPFVLGRWSPTRGSHFEVDARNARYAWLVKTAKARGASAVAVGHTRDDQAETVLQRILRGTGLRGLSGIPSRRGLGGGVVLVRPLLDVSRRELLDYLGSLGQPFRDDPTNADLGRTRARIRHDLLPKLAAEYNPKVAEALARLAGAARASERAVGGVLDDVEKKIMAPSLDNIVVRRSRLRRFPKALRPEVIRRAWRRRGWPEGGMTARHWLRLAGLAAGRAPGRFDVGAGVVAEAREGLFVVSRPELPTGPPLSPPGPRPLDVPGSVEWPGGAVVATLGEDGLNDETIDLDRLDGPLVVRPPRPGERFAPLGMNGHARPLRDFLRGRGVPVGLRPFVPLVCDRQGIVWVVGHRIADRVKRTEATTRALGLRWTHGDPG